MTQWWEPHICPAWLRVHESETPQQESQALVPRGSLPRVNKQHSRILAIRNKLLQHSEARVFKDINENRPDEAFERFQLIQKLAYGTQGFYAFVANCGCRARAQAAEDIHSGRFKSAFGMLKLVTNLPINFDSNVFFEVAQIIRVQAMQHIRSGRPCLAREKLLLILGLHPSLTLPDNFFSQCRYSSPQSDLPDNQ